jgi:tetratricopeptide (TPR) repeat protein
MVAALAAALLCSAALADDSKDPLAAAKALSENGHFNAAIAALSKIIDGATDRSTLEQAYIERAEAWKRAGFQQPGNDQPFVNALDDYTRAIRVHGENQLARRNRASIYADLGAYDEAYVELEELRRLELATSAPFWSSVRLGGIKRVLGEYDAALAAFDEAISNWAPEPVMPPNYHKAITLLKMKAPALALQALDEGLRAQPDYGSAYEFRACANAALGRFKEALADLRKSEELNAVYPKPEAKLAAVEHDMRIEAERRSYLEAVIAGREEPNQSRIEGLCFSSWWMIHFQSPRERSKLLPAK